MESYQVATDQRFPLNSLPLLRLHDIDYSTTVLGRIKGVVTSPWGWGERFFFITEKKISFWDGKMNLVSNQH